MGSHAKEYAVFFKDRKGNASKKFSVVKNKQREAEEQGKRFGFVHDMIYSHVTLVRKLSEN